MRVVFAGQVPKDPGYPESIEDALEVSPLSGRVAVSDGASESFDSKTWAKLLVATFVDSPALHPGWLPSVVEQYLACHDLATLSWSKHAAFGRGSFATLLGVEQLKGRSEIDVLAVGDTLAVLLSGSNRIDSFPYSESQQFQQRPELFSTNASHNKFVEESDFFTRHQKTWDLGEIDSPVVLCMTDALAEWAIRMEEEGFPQWEALLSITEPSQLESIVLLARGLRRMRVDDVTLISMVFDRVADDELPDA